LKEAVLFAKNPDLYEFKVQGSGFKGLKKSHQAWTLGSLEARRIGSF
jgi:hypothetical protein